MKRTYNMLGSSNYARFIVMTFLLGLACCTKPTPVQFNNVCRKENASAYVAVEGYLRTGSSVLCSSREGTRACGLELIERSDGGGKISVFVEEGTGKSQMEPLPKSYSTADLRIRTFDGQVIRADERVRVVGIASNGADVVDSSYSICFIEVERIEKP